MNVNSDYIVPETLDRITPTEKIVSGVVISGLIGTLLLQFFIKLLFSIILGGKIEATWLLFNTL